MKIRHAFSSSFGLAALPLCVALQGCGGGGSGAGATVSPASSSGDTGKPVAVALWPSSTAAAGSTVLVSGTQFTGDCAVQISLGDDKKVMLTKTGVGMDGTFAVQAAIPTDTPVGTHDVSAQGLSGANCDEPSANAVAEPLAVVEIDPIIELDTVEGRPGGVTLVNGRGFCGAAECSTVSVLADGSVAAADVEVAEDGTFSAEARIPAVDNAGEIMVVALQTDADGNELRGFGDLIVTVRPEGERPEVVQ